MAVLQELDIQARARKEGYLSAASGAGIDVSAAGPIFDMAKELIAKEFWAWYANHYNDTVKIFRVWFIRKTVRISDLRPVFVLLLGDPE